MVRNACKDHSYELCAIAVSLCLHIQLVKSPYTCVLYHIQVVELDIFVDY